jgi:hypothetical protein
LNGQQSTVSRHRSFSALLPECISHFLQTNNHPLSTLYRVLKQVPSLEIPNDVLKQLEGAPELLAVMFGERGEGFG